ncbi:AmmeMemoRadiSam system protein B [Uliginosibacterium aquaticum]|uniref:MEMO1 family protein HJ583_018625 n=1 Tax=Uliginosibacterium aquaticum TaxID=2731212 RepID=A0ABX2IL62_9RHOO|nr:AmmeMemoRadiSam system protein B [Uliginosibacterium aquaticum]NSL57052.1 AmmeMemoRadiSam system protein B [Uliginosibacterium aquaticum]
MATQPVRPAAVAGLFYPADPHTLSAQLHSLLAQTERPSALQPPKALIVPHAGYMYSGPIAASAYAMLEALRDIIRRVVLVGPSHRVAFAGAALPGCAAFATPLGNVEIDSEAVFTLAQRPGVVFDDSAHAQEHALEVQLPFLQTVLEHFRILPLTLGMIEAQQVAELLEAVWGGPETLIVVSSDLSHYHPYAQAQADDMDSIGQILEGEGPLNHEQACGATAINALSIAARRHGLLPRLLDLRNSGDTAGDRSRVVGYAALSFSPGQRRTH